MKIKLFLLSCNCHRSSFSRSCICLCVLPTNWESLLVTNSSITSNLLESFNISWNKSSQVSLYDMFLEFITNQIKFCFREFINFSISFNFYFIKYFLSCRSTNTIYIGKSNLSMFSVWKIDTSNSSHEYSFLNI